MADPHYLPWANLEGRDVHVAEVRLSAVREDFMVGRGVFETIKVREGRLVFLPEHLHRLEGAAKACGLSLPSPEVVRQRCESVIGANALAAGSLKLILCPGNGGAALLVLARDRGYGADVYRRGFRVKLQVDPRLEGPERRIKTLDYSPNLEALRAARRDGWDETLFHSAVGHVREGAITNVFIVEHDAVITPSLANYVLPGIARAQVIALLGCRVQEVDELSRARVLAAEEIFVTNVLMGVMPVSKIDNRVLDLKADGVTARLRRDYEAREARSLC